MRTAIHHLSIGAVRADALSVSALQRSEEPSTERARHAVIAAGRASGSQGCAERVAQELRTRGRRRAAGPSPCGVTG